MAASAASSVLGVLQVSNAAINKTQLVHTWTWNPCSTRASTTRARAKFERFEVQPEQVSTQSNSTGENGDENEALTDSVLPTDLENAVEQSAESTCEFLQAEGKRAIVELSVEELENFDVDGAQQLRWECSRLFIKSVQKRMKNQQIKAVFPDMGAAASIKYQWDDETIKFGSLNDRRPVSKEDDIIVLIAPDYQMVGEVQKIAYSLLDEDSIQHQPLIMWNPQLFSGDVGIGLNARRINNEFLRTFTTVYSLNSLREGAIFKRYPGLWKIFMDDKQTPGRYLLVKELVTKPSADELDSILLQGSAAANSSDPESPSSPSFFANAMATISSFSRFMKSLSR